jgi:DNA-binding transcriptional MerR regulator
MRKQDLDKGYSTKYVLKLSGLSKSTLFRWEKKGLISVERGFINNRRIYTRGSLRGIFNLIIKKEELKLARAKSKEVAPSAREKIMERRTVFKIILGDQFEPSELSKPFSNKNVKLLFSFINENYPQVEKEWKRIFYLVVNQNFRDILKKPA